MNLSDWVFMGRHRKVLRLWRLAAEDFNVDEEVVVGIALTVNCVQVS